MPGSLAIRPMSSNEVELALEWAAREGWNPGLDDANCFRRADPDGFLMAFVDGQPAVSLSAVRYGPDFAFLGLYIADPEFRGQGYALRLWQSVLERLDGYRIGLDGVPERQPSYRQSGFELAWRNVRYTGTPSLESPADPRLLPVDLELIPTLLDYDRAFFPAPRAEFMRCWLTGSPTRQSWALVEDGAVRGYGTIRQCRAGWKIGPLFAEDESTADLLFRQLASVAGLGPVILDVPEPNGKAVNLAVRYRLSPVFETARMYRGDGAPLPLDRTYGITTFELG